MEVHVQELIDSIRKDGVAAAEAEAKKILDDAQQRADRIVKEAQQKSDKLIKDGEAAIQRREQSAEAALDQAGRDLLLSVEKRLTGMVEGILTDAISAEMKGKTLEKMLVEIAKQDLAAIDSQIEISASSYESLSKELIGELKKKLSKGTDIKPVKHIDAGFRIAEKSGSGYISFTPEDLAEMLSAYVSPELQKIIRKSAES